MTSMKVYEELAMEAKNAYLQEKMNNQATIQIRVQLGICSMSVEAREVYSVFRDLATVQGQGEVVITKTGCAGLCSLEPLVEIRKPGQKPIVYCRVTPEKARLIFLNHIKRNQVIVPWTLSGKDVE